MTNIFTPENVAAATALFRNSATYSNFQPASAIAELVQYNASLESKKVDAFSLDRTMNKRLFQPSSSEKFTTPTNRPNMDVEHNLPPTPGVDPAVANGGLAGHPEVVISKNAEHKSSRLKIVHHKGDLQNGLKMYPPSFHDSHLLATQGEQRRTSLIVRLGKQLYPDPIAPFLKNLMGNGKCSSQWAGRMTAPVNTRHVHFEHFRHILYNPTTSQTSTNAPYPTQITGDATHPGFILTPNNLGVFDLVPGTTGGISANNTSFRELTTNCDYWAPFNRPDYEDMSWNLCKLRLIPDFTNDPSAPTSQFSVQQQLFDAAAHRAQSLIYQGNQYVPQVSQNEAGGGAGISVPGQARYTFNTVFNKGKIEYQFMNKGSGGAKVELIVYRHKKNSAWTPDISGWYPSGGVTPTPSFKMLQTTIGGGYLKKIGDTVATDSLGGRIPVVGDISINPNYPLFPTLKQTLQSNLAFVESDRQTFAMASGDRRNVTIMLPGIVYDPTTTVVRQGFTTNLPTELIPAMDQYTYTICIACSGGLATNEYLQDATTTDPVQAKVLLGDQYAAANIQYLCTYTEYIGAMQYQTPSTKNIYCRGSLLQPDPTVSGWSQNTVTMLSQNQAVRIPPSRTTVKNAATLALEKVEYQEGGTTMDNDSSL